VTVRPVAGASATPSSPGLPAWIWIAGIGVIALVIVITRRRGRRLREAEA
jgi:hypothetical protein